MFGTSKDGDSGAPVLEPPTAFDIGRMEVGALLAEVIQLRSQLEVSNHERRMIAERNIRLQDEILSADRSAVKFEAAYKLSSEALEEAKRLERINANLEARIEIKDDRIHDLEGAHSTLSASISERDLLISGFRAAAESFEEQRAEFFRQLSGTATELEALKTQLGEAQEKIQLNSNAAEIVARQGVDLKRLQMRLSGALAENTTLLDNMWRKDNSIAQKNNRINEIESENERLKQELLGLTEKFKLLESENKTLNLESARLHDHNDQFSRTILKLNEHIRNLESENSALKIRSHRILLHSIRHSALYKSIRRLVPDPIVRTLRPAIRFILSRA